MTEDSPAFVFVRFRALRRKGPFRRFSARYPSRCSIGRSDGAESGQRPRSRLRCAEERDSTRNRSPEPVWRRRGRRKGSQQSRFVVADNEFEHPVIAFGIVFRFEILSEYP